MSDERIPTPGQYFYIEADQIHVFSSFAAVTSFFESHIEAGHDVEIIVKPLEESGPNRYRSIPVEEEEQP